MPIYEYHCERCDQTFELIQKFSDEPLTSHEGCGGAVEKLLSHSSLRFKGTGWYVTDYAHKNGGSARDKKESKESSSDSSTKDSKPAPAAAVSAASKSDSKSDSKSTSKSDSK